MTIRMGIDSDGKIRISTGPERVRIESVEKFLGRNDDAILVRLEGSHDPSMTYKPGHLCRIEESEDHRYIAFVGNHMIGYLPAEAIAFAEQVDSSPDCLVSMVGKVEDDVIYIYIAE